MMGSKKLVTWALVGALAIGAAGCSQSTGPNQSGGTVIGAVAGGLIGSRFGGGGGKVAAVIAGTMLGGIVGSQIGKNMDDEARQQAYNARIRRFRPVIPTTGNPATVVRAGLWSLVRSIPKAAVFAVNIPIPLSSTDGRSVV